MQPKRTKSQQQTRMSPKKQKITYRCGKGESGSQYITAQMFLLKMGLKQCAEALIKLKHLHPQGALLGADKLIPCGDSIWRGLFNLCKDIKIDFSAHLQSISEKGAAFHAMRLRSRLKNKNSAILDSIILNCFAQQFQKVTIWNRICAHAYYLSRPTSEQKVQCIIINLKKNSKIQLKLI